MAYRLGPRSRFVFDTVRDRILRGELKPGSRLPSHTELASAFGVASLTVRQALAHLEEQGLISREHGRGTFVSRQEVAGILVVERDATTRLLVGEYVHTAGLRVVAVAESADGLLELENDPAIRLIITGLRLPTVDDGVAFIRAARRRRPDLPLAAITDNPDDLVDLQETPDCPVLVIQRPIQAFHIEKVVGLVFQSATRSPTAERLPVLVADDDPDIRYVLSELISDQGLEVEEAANGQEVLAALRRRQFSHVFQDLRMPGGGTELAAAIATLYPATAVVIVTAYPESAVHEVKGPITVLPKPFDASEVRAALQWRRLPVDRRAS